MSIDSSFKSVKEGKRGRYLRKRQGRTKGFKGWRGAYQHI